MPVLRLSWAPCPGLPETAIIQAHSWKGRPPYCSSWGMPSYEACPCGFEFDNDDEPGTAQPSTFEAYLAAWVAGARRWLDETRRPANWSLEQQLSEVRRIAAVPDR